MRRKFNAIDINPLLPATWGEVEFPHAVRPNTDQQLYFKRGYYIEKYEPETADEEVVHMALILETASNTLNVFDRLLRKFQDISPTIDFIVVTDHDMHLPQGNAIRFPAIKLSKLRRTLNDFKDVLLSDGYAAFAACCFNNTIQVILNDTKEIRVFAPSRTHLLHFLDALDDTDLPLDPELLFEEVHFYCYTKSVYPQRLMRLFRRLGMKQ